MPAKERSRLATPLLDGGRLSEIPGLKACILPRPSRVLFLCPGPAFCFTFQLFTTVWNFPTHHVGVGQRRATDDFSVEWCRFFHKAVIMDEFCQRCGLNYF